MILHGAEACAALEQAQGIELNEMERRVVMCEGYASGEPYRDTKGILTSGVGQTGEWLNRPFRDAFLHHVERVKNRFPDFRLFPSYLRTELVASEYRGDLGLSPKACEHVRLGRWEVAAGEFLDNAEFKNPATPEGIKRRLKALHYALMLRAMQ
jgi:hypothetical protein